MRTFDQVIRAARRRVGSRSTRRRGTNGKISGPSRGGKSRSPMRTNPIPVKSAGVVKIHQLAKEMMVS